MSQEPVAVVRRYFELIEGENLVATFSGFAAALALMDPDLEVRWNERHPDPGPFKGVEAAMVAAAEWLESFAEYVVRVREVREVGDRVVVLFTEHGRGKGSGAATEQELAHVFEVRDGLIVRLEEYLSFQEALEAARR